MKTIIFDIDGTLTDMSAIENAAFLGVTENCWPKPNKYPLVDWILRNKNNYNFVYATGGKEKETLYVLESLGLLKYFDIKNSINKSNYRFSKKTGLPFLKIKKKYPDCLLVTDSQDDCIGAKLAKIPYMKIIPGKDIKKTLTYLQ